MEYQPAQYQPLTQIEYSMEKQLLNGFKGFVRMLMGNKTSEKKEITGMESGTKKNYFFEKYQQLLISGRTSNVQVVRVERKHEQEKDKNTIVYLTYQAITDRGVRLFTAAAMATRESIPVINTIIPIFYNPKDPSLVVLL